MSSMIRNKANNTTGVNRPENGLVGHFHASIIKIHLEDEVAALTCDKIKVTGI